MSANDTQISGNHYKDKTVQPWDYIAANNLGYFEGNVVRYISRWRDKGGVDDLRKAKHYIEKLIELETQVKTEHKGERLILPTDDGPLWIQWDGGLCPLAPDTKVQVMLMTGEEANGTADCFYWNDAVSSQQVRKYRVIKGESKTIHGFIPWTGGEQPVADDVEVEVLLSDSHQSGKQTLFAGHVDWSWSHLVDALRVIGYRVIK
jgi:hypothetical protein